MASFRSRAEKLPEISLRGSSARCEKAREAKCLRLTDRALNCE